MPRISKNQQKFNQVAPEAKENGCSNWIDIEILKLYGFNWSKNGNQRHGKFLGLTKYIWEAQKVKNKVVAIRTTGYDPDIEAAELLKNRPISKGIRKYYKGKCCVACGGNKEMVIDHKNDLYDEPRVHNIHTQQVDDFQPLCNNCNLKKRADCRKTKETGIRQPAPFQFTSLGLPKYYMGDENFEPNGLGLEGTYWYDIEVYKNHCKTLITLS